MASKFTSFFASRDYTFIAALLFFGIMAVLFTTPVQEGDFYWHVKTGQWIWQHKSLPSVDTFSYFNNFVPPTKVTIENTQFLMNQYWLGQLALFGVWNAAGEAGAVVLRTLTYTSILGGLYWWLVRGRNGTIPLLVVFFIGSVMRSFPGERPQIFAFIFVVLLLYLLEQISARNGSRKFHAILLFLTMFIWGNCHGSFILGIALVVLYGVCHTISALAKRVAPDYTLMLIFTGAIFISGLNPNGFEAFYFVIGDRKGGFVQNIEAISPLTEMFSRHIFRYHYWALIAAVIITVSVKFRSLKLPHIVIPLALAALSLSALRYIPFFIIAAPLALNYLPDWKPRGKYILLPLAAVLLWVTSVDFTNTLKFRPHKAFPVEATRFINTVKPPENIFNYVYWGGYLMHYTDYPVLVDGRGLAEKSNDIHGFVMEGINWQGTLSLFNINTIIIPGTSEGSMRIYPILMQLHRDNNWALIYQDDVALVFLRNAPKNRAILERYTISKDLITKHITKRLEWQINNEM